MSDQPCDKMIDAGASGFCDCKLYGWAGLGEHLNEQLRIDWCTIQGKVAGKHCNELSLSCGAACKEEIDNIIRNSEEVEAELTTSGQGAEAAHLLSIRVESVKQLEAARSTIEAKRSKGVVCEGSMKVVGNRMVCVKPGDEERRRISWDHYHVLHLPRDSARERK